MAAYCNLGSRSAPTGFAMGEPAGSQSTKPRGQDQTAFNTVAVISATMGLLALACVGAFAWSASWEPSGDRRSSIDLLEPDSASHLSRFTESSFPWLHTPGIPLRLLQLEESRGTDVTHISTLGHGGVEFGSAESWHNKPPRGQDPTLNADQLMDQVASAAARDGPHPVLGASGAGLPVGLAHGLAV